MQKIVKFSIMGHRQSKRMYLHHHSNGDGIAFSTELSEEKSVASPPSYSRASTHSFLPQCVEPSVGGELEAKEEAGPEAKEEAGPRVQIECENHLNDSKVDKLQGARLRHILLYSKKTSKLHTLWLEGNATIHRLRQRIMPQLGVYGPETIHFLTKDGHLCWSHQTIDELYMNLHLEITDVLVLYYTRDQPLGG